MGLFKKKVLKPNEIKLMFRNKVPMIKATINGKGAKLIIDTGASISLVDKSVKHIYGFRFFGEPIGVSGVGGLSDMHKASNIDLKLKLGKLDIDFNTTNMASVRKASGASGVLGGNFLKKYKCSIDYDKKILTIFT